jgi:carbon monoxide dehydrogenase subunit G
MTDEGTSDGRGTQLEFEDTVEMAGEMEDLWSFISDPENLVECVPGAEEIDRRSETEYSFVIVQGIGRFSVTLEGDVELVEMNEPEYIVADGAALDTGTGSEFDVLAAMEMRERDDGTLELAYTAEVTITGGVASIGARFTRRVVRSRMDDYFDNVRAQFEATDPDDDEQPTFA